ncbi:unnamed protein product, partial [Ectocarpus fasciculatus]
CCAVEAVQALACLVSSTSALSGRGAGVLLCFACLSGWTIGHASSRGRSIVPTGPITDGQSFLPALPKVAKKHLPQTIYPIDITSRLFNPLSTALPGGDERKFQLRHHRVSFSVAEEAPTSCLRRECFTTAV